MAKADSVPSSTLQLITGESANQSTNPRAVAVKPPDRGYLIRKSGARVTMAEQDPLLGLWREKQRNVEPEDLSNRRWYGPGTGSMGSNVGAYATAALFLRWLGNILLTLLLFLTKNKRSRFSALDKVSSNHLVRSRPQGRLK